MKNLHFTKSLFSLFLLFVLSTSCEKSNPKEPVSLNQFENVKSLKQVPEIEKMELSNFKDKDVIDLIEQLKPTKLNQGLTSKTIFKVTFKNLPTLIGFYIKGEETGQITEDIFYVFETRSKLNLFITREKTGFADKNNNNGYISIRDINNDLLFNDYVEQNRYVMNLNLTSNVFSSNSNSKSSTLSTCSFVSSKSLSNCSFSNADRNPSCPSVFFSDAIILVAIVANLTNWSSFFTELSINEDNIGPTLATSPACLIIFLSSSIKADIFAFFDN